MFTEDKKKRKALIKLFLDAIYKRRIKEALQLLKNNPDLVNTPLSPEIYEDNEDADRIIHAVAQTGGVIPVLKWLLDHEVSVDQLGSDRQTPLHGAAWVGNVAEMKFLLERGANLEAKNAGGETPIDLTFHAYTPEAFEFLISKGAKPSFFIAMAWDQMDMIEEMFRTWPREKLLDRLVDLGLLQVIAQEGPPDHVERKLQILEELGLN